MANKIKDFFCNKIFVFILMFFAFLFSFATSCLATDFPDYSSIASKYNYYFILDNGSAMFFGTNTKPYTNIYNNAEWLFLDDFDRYEINSGNWVLFKHYSSDSVFRLSSLQNTGITVPVSNFELLDLDGNTVFLVAPAEEAHQVAQIPALEQAEQIPQAMGETLKVVLPIGLAVFGIGLVIFLMRYLISRLM